MGFRTVVVLNNDQAGEWEKDPELGLKIWTAACKLYADSPGINRFEYGQIIEQVHADLQTVAFLDGYGGEAMAHSHWSRGQTTGEKNLNMLKALADRMGYRISKKPTKK